MKFTIVTGMSGAGKSTALRVLEDIGYYCVDNLPPELVGEFVRLCTNTKKDIENIGLGIDARGQHIFEHMLNEVLDEIEDLKKNQFEVNVLFLDASDATILRRYKETRRKHPLVSGGRIEDGIAKERSLLAEIRRNSDYILDTSTILSRELREEILSIYGQGKKFHNLYVTVMSFGFKYGVPMDSDLVFDARFLPNPYYHKALREKTGADQAVNDYVMQAPETNEFLDKLYDLIRFLLPNYMKEGKNQLVISIGCTGGQHRSVTIANRIYEWLKQEQVSVNIFHRDMNKTK